MENLTEKGMEISQMDLLSQWEEEAKSHFGCPPDFEVTIKAPMFWQSAERILALIELIRKKDFALDTACTLICCCGEPDVYGNPIQKCAWHIALALTDQLEKENPK